MTPTRHLRFSIAAATVVLAFVLGLPSSALATHDETAMPVTEFTADSVVPQLADQCANNLDDDGDGAVNDGCRAETGGFIPGPETGTACANATDDDFDGFINDGCPAIGGAEARTHDSPVPLTAAGAHPDLKLHMRFCGPEDGSLNHGCSPSPHVFQLRDLLINLPPGLIGNPTALDVCPTHLWLVDSCPEESALGFSLSQAVPIIGGGLVPIAARLFNIQTLGFEPARLGTSKIFATPLSPLPITVGLRTTTDFGINSTLKDIPKQAGTLDAQVMTIDAVLHGRLSNGKPFIVNPTSCNLAEVEVDVSSWARPDLRTKLRDPITPPGDPTGGPTGCNDPATPSNPTPAPSPPFDLDVQVNPDSDQAGKPSGYTVKLEYPDYALADPWQAQLRHAKVTLPDGVSLASGAGVGLEACSFEDFYGPNVHSSNDYANRTDDPVLCPPSSQIGDIKVESPALPTIGTDADGDPFDIEGKAFFGPTGGAGGPSESKPWKLFLLLEGHGLRIKLPAGDVALDAQGRISTAFAENPQVPFKTFKLHTNDGNRAPLSNPRFCGTHTGEALLTSWGDSEAATPTRTRNPTIDITGCAGDPEPFGPQLQDASAVPTQAGASSVSHLRFTRPDGHQFLNSLKLSLPVGAVGNIAAVPLCPAATVNALPSNPDANCPASSKVGKITTTVGFGTAVIDVPGQVYIGEGTQQGDAATFVIVIPAKVGPIDLGRVVVVNHATLRSSDTGVDVTSPPIPTILGGIPLPVQAIDILVDREGFFLNPTNCNRVLFSATFGGDRGATSVGTFPTQATGCDRLPFAPKLRLIAGGPGGTATGSNTPLKAIVTQQPGEANIAKARVVVPDLIRPDVPQIQKPGALCNDVQLAARACPALSQIGNANVITPVLPFKLSGPVYIVLKTGSPLPNLAVFLRGPGGLEVLLTAGNGFQGIKILNTFDSVPDVPQSRFELNVNGGSNGILLAHSNLCTANPLPQIDGTFTGQNGKVLSTKPTLEVDGCASASRARRAYISKRMLKMSKNGTVKIKITCPGRQRSCAGQLTLDSAGAARTAARLAKKSFRITRTRGTVRVKLSRRVRRQVIRKSFARTRITVKITGGETSRRTVTIRGPRR